MLHSRSSIDHLFTLQDEEERPRPEFAAKAPYLEKNPITGVREPAFPQAVRMKRIAAGSGIIILMVRGQTEPEQSCSELWLRQGSSSAVGHTVLAGLHSYKQLDLKTC